MLIFSPSEFKYFFWYLFLRWDLKVCLYVWANTMYEIEKWSGFLVFFFWFSWISVIIILFYDGITAGQECNWWELKIQVKQLMAETGVLRCVLHLVWWSSPGFYFPSLVWPQGSYDMSSVNCTWILQEMKVFHPSPGFSLLEPEALCPAPLWHSCFWLMLHDLCLGIGIVC